MATKFRRKFRLPLDLVHDIVEQLGRERSDVADKPAGGGRGKGPARHPLIMKVLAALRHLAKGDDYESLEDASQISESTLKKFIPSFMNWFAKSVSPNWVKLPEGEALQDSMAVYKRLGFPGAYCETDGVHLAWDACPSKWHAKFKGKEAYPTLAFNVSVLHSKWIIHTTTWVAGTVNDKTQAKNDDLLHDLRAQKIHPEIVYYLYDSQGARIPHTGVYALVDNGYLQWRCLQAPLKHAAGDDGALWSKRLESVRKGVECTFGILKRRFRILRQAFQLRDPEAINDIFTSCCALHNMLLQYDRLHTIGRRPADWVPAHVYRQREAVDVDRSKHVVRAPAPKSVPAQAELGFFTLREALITHYAQATAKRELGWLRPASEVRSRGHDAEDHEEAEPEFDEDEDEAHQFEEGDDSDTGSE